MNPESRDGEDIDGASKLSADRVPLQAFGDVGASVDIFLGVSRGRQPGCTIDQGGEYAGDARRLAVDVLTKTASPRTRSRTRRPAKETGKSNEVGKRLSYMLLCVRSPHSC